MTDNCANNCAKHYESLIQQSESLLGLNRISDYCPTRFLSLFTVLDSVCHQFPLLRKIINSSNDRELLSYFRDKTFVVHLDQFIVHTTPIYSFTKEVQTPSLSLYGCLGKMLELIKKLLNRLGHSLILSPAGYVSNLYDTKTGKPLRFPNKSSALHVTEYEHIQVALDQLSEYDVKAIQLLWSQYNEQKLHRLLDQFSPFLLSPIVRRCYIIYETQSSDKYIRVLGNLCKYVHCNGVKALDELASVRLEHTTEASLDAMFTQSLLSTSPTLRRLVQYIKIVIPHNMIVEAGFSKMKFSEGVFQPETGADLYDSLRFVSDFFDRESFEKYIPPQILLNQMSAASHLYKESEKQRMKEKDKLKVKSNELRRQIGIYQRRSSKVLKRELSETEKELAEAEKVLQNIKEKKERLQNEQRGINSRSDDISAKIVNVILK